MMENHDLLVNSIQKVANQIFKSLGYVRFKRHQELLKRKIDGSVHRLYWLQYDIYKTTTSEQKKYYKYFAMKNPGAVM